jgi:hypothetical protein
MAQIGRKTSQALVRITFVALQARANVLGLLFSAG